MALNDICFDVDRYSDGVRIYAKLAHETIGVLDARTSEDVDSHLAVTAIYVVPRWRDQGVASAMLEQFEEYNSRLLTCSVPEAGN